MERQKNLTDSANFSFNHLSILYNIKKKLKGARVKQFNPLFFLNKGIHILLTKIQ